MSTILLLLLAFACVLLEIAFAPGATVFGGRAQLSLVVIALWSVLRPADEAMLLAPAAGLLLGLLGNEPLGLSVLAFAPVVALGMLNEERSIERRFVLTLGLVALGTFVYAVADLTIFRLAGRTIPVAFSTLQAVLVVTILNLVLAAVLY
ncbi:MAG: rod shape-determining protein MreD, partial [Chloroflexota bacterium]|nr:rod shape-determining protein MreD [Chloroflexota bacterium]